MTNGKLGEDRWKSIRNGKTMERYSKISKEGKKNLYLKPFTLVLINGLDSYIFLSIKILFNYKIDLKKKFDFHEIMLTWAIKDFNQVLTILQP